jgi:prolyl-tRNA synthetase
MLGQNFARASDIRFQTEKGDEAFAWTTSWGVSTRLIGGLIMCHADDDGMVMPPRISPAHVVLLPIIRKDADREKVMTVVDNLAGRLRGMTYAGRPLAVETDTRDIGGARNWEWIKKGIPLRVEIGPRDIDQNAVPVARRDRGHKDKIVLGLDRLEAEIGGMLDDIQATLLGRAVAHREEHTVRIDDRKAFYAFFTPENPENPEIHGGFALSPWCGSARCEEKIKEELSVTIRCLPLEATPAGDQAPCVCCGGRGEHRAVFAKAY